MAEENNRIPRQPDPGFVSRLVPDPASPPELALLVGYPGASAEKGAVRLYASPDLSRWWEIPEDEILHRQTVPNDSLGAEILWVRRDKQPVLHSRRSESDMNTYTFIPFCGPTLQQPPQPHTISGLNCATGPQQHLPFTIAGFNCPTGLPQPQPQPQTVTDLTCATGPARVPFTQICGTTPVDAAVLHPTFFGTCTIPPVTMGCQQHPYQAASQIGTTMPPPPPPTHACYAQGYAWPYTLDVYCGTSPVAQGAQAHQQTYAVQTFGPTMTVPPVTFCCPR